MSAITVPAEPPPASAPEVAEWVPAPESLYRMSVEKYEEMVSSGVFTKHDRFELIQGILVTKMTEYPKHTWASDASRFTLESLLPAGWYVRIDKPLRIPAQASVPEPDLVVARGSFLDYGRRHPEPADVALVVEIADSSLSQDRALVHVFGGGGVPIYWIVNLVDRQVEVYSDPCPTGYQSRQDFQPGQHVPLTIDGVKQGSIAVSDVLPPA
jgi:Uma2 family endonuclease